MLHTEANNGHYIIHLWLSTNVDNEVTAKI